MGATRVEKKGVGSMLSRAAKQFLIWGGVLILVGALSLVNQLVELSPWVWAAFLAGSGLGALGLYLADRSDGHRLCSRCASDPRGHWRSD